jgi:hypothetical protein
VSTLVIADPRLDDLADLTPCIVIRKKRTAVRSTFKVCGTLRHFQNFESVPSFDLDFTSERVSSTVRSSTLIFEAVI